MNVGTVTQLPSGRWWARGPRPERVSLGTYETEPEAREVIVGAVNRLLKTDRSRLPGATVADFGARVVKERAKELPRSAAAEGTRWRRILASPLAELPIVRLTTPKIDRWARELALELPGSAKPTFSLLSAVCREAVRAELLPANPCRDVKIRLPPRTEEPWTYLTPEEQRALLSVPIPEEDALQIGVLLGTGIRDGELFSLRLADVHAHAREPFLKIRHGSPNGPPKGKKIRDVPLFGLGLRSVRRWLEILPEYCPKNPRALAFPGRRGGFQDAGAFLVRQTTVERKKVYLDDFREALRLADITRPVRAHDLRHTFAASLVSGWWGDPWRLEDLRPVMGHHSITVTQMYAHLAPSRIRELAARSPGLQVGYGPERPIALSAAIAAPIALLPRAPAGTRCSTRTEETAGESAGGGGAHHPPITRQAAIEGLRALRRGDLDAARLVAASGWGEGELCRIFEGALAEENVPRPEVAVGDTAGRR